MALASNQKEQMAKRLKQDLELLAPEFTASMADSSTVELKSGSTVIALLSIRQRSFSGFNVVAELSSSAAEGLPEHEMWLVVKDDQSLTTMAKLTKAAAAMACSSLKIAVEAAVDAADVGDETKVDLEMPNDARVGFSGR